MTNNIKFSLKDVQDSIEVTLEGYGDLTVRRLGAGESLDIAACEREVSSLVVKAQELRESVPANVTKENKASLDKTIGELEAVLDAIQKLRLKEIEIYARCLDFGDDKKSLEVVDQIPIAKLSTFIDDLFAKAAAITPEK